MWWMLASNARAQHFCGKLPQTANRGTEMQAIFPRWQCDLFSQPSFSCLFLLTTTAPFFSVWLLATHVSVFVLNHSKKKKSYRCCRLALQNPNATEIRPPQGHICRVETRMSLLVETELCSYHNICCFNSAKLKHSLPFMRFSHAWVFSSPLWRIFHPLQCQNCWQQQWFRFRNIIFLLRPASSSPSLIW